MASLCIERGKVFRIHWKFKVRVGPRADETIEGSMQLGRCTKAAAKARLREFEEWEHSVKTGRHVPGEAWTDVRSAWLRERELTATPQTLQRSVRVLSLYIRWREANGLPTDTVEQVARRTDLLQWREHRLDHEAGRKTVANDLGTLKTLFAWCVREKYLTENPMDRISLPRVGPRPEPRPLTRGEAGRWLRSIRTRTTPLGKGPRTFQEVRRKRQIAVFLLNTGVRNGELCVLSIEDLRIDAVEQMVRVVGKGMKARWVPLNRAAIAAIHCNLRDRGNPTSGPLFVTPNGDRYNVRQFSSEMVKSARYLDEAIDVNPHNLRHTFATWLARATSDVAIVQKILGHENVNTTLKYYVHTSNSELAGATATLRPAASRAATRPPARVESRSTIIPFPKIQAG